MNSFYPALFCLLGMGVAASAQPTRMFVEMKPGSAAGVKATVARAGGTIHHEFADLNAMAVTIPGQALNGLKNNPNILLVEPDPQRQLLATAEYTYGVNMVQAPQVWDLNLDGILDSAAPIGANIKVGVIDTGIDVTHPEFAALYNAGQITGEPVGWNTDGHGHGTHVSGTILAQMNNVGVVGVAPGASLHMVKVFGSSGQWIYSSDLLAAANQCQKAGVKIISMSLGGSFKSRTEERGFDTLYNLHGILLVAAAGNGGNKSTSYPAGYASVVSVGAVDSASRLAWFSQRNADVELVAPGVSVLSTIPGGGYASYNGTSMATPHVSAVAALLWSGSSTATASAVRNALQQTAQDLGAAGRDTSFGFGLVKGKTALDLLNGN